MMAITALLQETASGGNEANVVLIIAAMTSFVTLCGVIVTGLVQWSATREARLAQREQRMALAAQVVKVEEIHTLVNSKDDKQSRIIADLTEQIKQLNASALARAESSPAVTVTAETPVPVVVVDTAKPVEVDVIDKKKPPRGK